MKASQPHINSAKNVSGMVHINPEREFSYWLALNAHLLNVEGLTGPKMS